MAGQGSVRSRAYYAYPSMFGLGLYVAGSFTVIRLGAKNHGTSKRMAGWKWLKNLLTTMNVRTDCSCCVLHLFKACSQCTHTCPTCNCGLLYGPSGIHSLHPSSCTRLTHTSQRTYPEAAVLLGYTPHSLLLSPNLIWVTPTSSARRWHTRWPHSRLGRRLAPAPSRYSRLHSR